MEREGQRRGLGQVGVRLEVMEAAGGEVFTGFYFLFLPDFSEDMSAIAGTGSQKLESGPPGCWRRSLGPGWRSRRRQRGGDGGGSSAEMER